jgi:hypothetical protein
LRFILVQNSTKIVLTDLPHFRFPTRVQGRFAPISVQNMPLEAEDHERQGAAVAGTETASFNIETIFNPTTLAGELDGQDRRRRNENGERERS